MTAKELEKSGEEQSLKEKRAKEEFMQFLENVSEIWKKQKYLGFALNYFKATHPLFKMQLLKLIMYLLENITKEIEQFLKKGNLPILCVVEILNSKDDVIISSNASELHMKSNQYLAKHPSNLVSKEPKFTIFFSTMPIIKFLAPNEKL